MYTGNGNPGCIRETATPCVYKKKVMGERIQRRLVTGCPTGKKGLRAFYLGRALRAYVNRGERQLVMYIGEGKNRSTK
jgi:hypothetical protein